MRRAVTIGVQQFGKEQHLSFARDRVGELEAALAELGFETKARPETRLDSAGIQAEIRQQMETAGAADLLVVHVLTHGELTGGDASLILLGSDERKYGAADVGRWLDDVQKPDANLPMTLFLLDVCNSGKAARLSWQPVARAAQARGWVIAACQGDQAAYDGRFTTAVTHVLRDLKDGGLGVEWWVRHVPLDVVAKAVQRKVNHLVRTDGIDREQRVTASLVDISDEFPDLPFFENPGYRGDPLGPLRGRLGPGLAPFVDDLIRTEPDAGGRLTGREDDVTALARWMSGTDGVRLRVVTGRPGSGKSALLRALVCFAQPQLRPHTERVWEGIAREVRPPALFAAVHLRGLDVKAAVRSLAEQLHLSGVTSAHDLAQRIAALRSPVIVVDGLHEAADPEELKQELLAPLYFSLRLPARPPDQRRGRIPPEPLAGGSTARLLIALRPDDLRFPGLADHGELDLDEPGRQEGGFSVRLDLDHVNSRALEDELFRYVTDRLRGTVYRDSGQQVGGFATQLARALSGQGQGAFLLARLYTDHLLRTVPTPPADPGAVEQLGVRAPRSLREMLDRDLAARAGEPLLRDVMTVLAHADGQGMPLTVLSRLVAAPRAQDVRDALVGARPYLRQTPDDDGTILYRIFDPAVADGLWRGASRQLLARLLGALGPSGARNWRAAEPYVLRHAFDHASGEAEKSQLRQDPGFLLEVRPDIVRRALGDSGPIRAAYDLSVDESVSPPRAMRDALALNAAREGLTDLAERTGSVPGKPPMNWRPCWVVGEKATFMKRKHAIRALAVGEFPPGQAGRPDGPQRYRDGPQEYWQWWWTGWNLEDADLPAGRALGSVVFLGDDHGLFAVRLADGKPLARFTHLGDQPVTAIRCGSITGDPWLVIVAGRQRRVIHLPTGRVIQTGAVDDPALADQPLVSGLIAVDETLVKVTGGTDGKVTVQRAGVPPTDQGWHDLGQNEDQPRRARRGERLHQDWTERLPEEHGSGPTVVACQHVNGQALAFTGGRDGKVRIWDLATLRRLELIEVPGQVRAIEATRAGDLVVLAGTEAIAFRHASAGRDPVGTGAP